jgi:hypothetical protein
MHSNGSVYDPGEGSCEHGKIPLNTTKSGDKEEGNFFRSTTDTTFSRKTFSSGDS